MSKNKQAQIPKKNELSAVRSSAAEYLTFVAATGSAQTSVEMRYEDENIWLTQKMMATVYDVSVPAINQHLKRIFADNELEEAAVIKQYLTTAADNKNYQVKHYSLQAIIAVGFKIENERAVQFRKWANQVVKDYTIQGWTMDMDRLKGGGSIPPPHSTTIQAPPQRNAFLRRFRTSCITPFTARQLQKSLWVGPITRRKTWA